MNKELVSFVIPCYNSTNTIEDVVNDIIHVMKEQLADYNFEIVLVNDCSPDRTTYNKICQLAEVNEKIKGINLARNFGQPSAVMAALNYAQGDYIVCGDDDGQTPFGELPRFFEKIEDGYDAVEAKFVKYDRRSLFRKFGTFMNESMQSWIIEKPKGLSLTSFWVIKKFVADEMKKYPNSHPYIGGLILRSTNNVCNVEVEKNERMSGKSGYNIHKMLELFLNGFTSFSTKPLRLISALGVTIGLVGIFSSFVTVIRKLLDPSINAGYTSLMAIILILFGLLFFILGIMGEYIGQTYIALNHAPQFIVKETINIKEEDNKK